MLTGKPPFYGEDKTEIFRAVRENDVEFWDKEWANISAEAQDFIRCGLKKNQYERHSSRQMMQHVWLSDF